MRFVVRGGDSCPQQQQLPPHPPAVSLHCHTAVSTHTQTGARYTSVHHGKWRGKELQGKPKPLHPPHPHSGRKETGALCYSLLTTNNSGLSTGRLASRCCRFAARLHPHPHHYHPHPGPVCYQFIICEYSFSPLHICSVPTMMNGTDSLMGNSFFT